MGSTFFYRGEFVRAQAHLEQSVALYQAQHHRYPVFLYGGQNRRSAASAMQPGPVVSWLSRAGPRRAEAARTLAQELAHPFGLAIALVFAAMLQRVPPGKSPGPGARGGRDDAGERARVSLG